MEIFREAGGFWLIMSVTIIGYFILDAIQNR